MVVKGVYLGTNFALKIEDINDAKEKAYNQHSFRLVVTKEKGRGDPNISAPQPTTEHFAIPTSSH